MYDDAVGAASPASPTTPTGAAWSGAGGGRFDSDEPAAGVTWGSAGGGRSDSDEPAAGTAWRAGVRRFVGDEPGRDESGRDAAAGRSRGGRGERRARAASSRGGRADGSARRGQGGNPPRHPEDGPGDPESVARAICLRLLTIQPRTRAELAAALARRAIPDDAAAAVLSRFAEVGLIDDHAFAEAWVGSRHTGRGLARRALAAELRRRGVDGETVGEAVATLAPETEERTARQLVAKRLPGTRRLEPAVRVRRLVGMLARKGYPPALAIRVVREELAAEGVDPGDLDGLDDAGPDD